MVASGSSLRQVFEGWLQFLDEEGVESCRRAMFRESFAVFLFYPACVWCGRG